QLFAQYPTEGVFYDEVFGQGGEVYSHYADIFRQFSGLSPVDFERLNEYAKLSFLNQGITYAVYSDGHRGAEQIFPFDLFPRVIPAAEWARLEEGLIQRNTALNLFIQDVYGGCKILKDKRIPSELIFSSSHYSEEMRNIRPPRNIYTHICGTDLIRHSDGNYYILEDNLRSPSGVSYVLSNRDAMKRTLSNAFRWASVEQVSEYTAELLATLQSVAPPVDDVPTCALLTPGAYNSAYFEHAFLAQGMGIELVEGRDLFVENNYVYMRTIHGPRRVDVLYRRIDDAFLDPMTFRPDSMLGVAGLMGAYRAGNVTIVNAPGTGVADDKAVCSYVPDMIRYYLDEDPIIPNVPTYLCERKEDLTYVLEHLSELVVKPVDMSGGYGVMICNQLSKAELEEVRAQVLSNPRNYIAQPRMSLSVHATYIEGKGTFEPRHIDLRTFTLLGGDLGTGYRK
ncbi:MAG: circularly permuted type 2 ATP-grasp protein, partial [Dolichospermum sp.]